MCTRFAYVEKKYIWSGCRVLVNDLVTLRNKNRVREHAAGVSFVTCDRICDERFDTMFLFAKIHNSDIIIAKII